MAAEDMEYDACLTVAASEQDSLKRIAFVGAFAMSNYSSTIGRIAKPFNPLLSQSFEYAIPNRYRYISEQVSHHPVSLPCSPTRQAEGGADMRVPHSLFRHVTLRLRRGSTSAKSTRRTNSRAEVSRSVRQAWPTRSLSYPRNGSRRGWITPTPGRSTAKVTLWSITRAFLDHFRCWC
jgi:hypothetical protein